VHVPVDIEGYRRRREDQLREIALRVASRVRTSGQAVTLEPMLAYERRIVHLSVQGQQGLKTESVGMEPNRRVVISSTAPGARGPFREGPSGGGFRPRPGGGAGGYGPRRGYGPRPGGYRPRPERGP
jgi:spoIIIJ-associated protein